MDQDARPVIVLVERTGHDRDALRAARARVAADAAPVLLVHVGRLIDRTMPARSTGTRKIEPWERMRAHEATILQELDDLGREWFGPATRVERAVRFGDVADELTALAASRDARAVVVRAEPGWRPWRRRDARLRALGDRLVLVGADAPGGAGHGHHVALPVR